MATAKVRRVQAAGRLSVAMRTIIEDTRAARRLMRPGYGRSTPPRAPAERLSVSALDRLGDRALGEDAAEMRLVLDRPLEVGLHVHALGGLLGGGLDRRRVELLANQPRLDALGPDGLGAGAGDGH